MNLTADAGSFELTGQDVTLKLVFRIIAESGTFTLTGQPIPKSISERLDSGTFTYSGQDISFKQGVFSGSFELIVGLTGVQVWGQLIPDQNPSWSAISPNQNPNWQQLVA